MTDCSPACLELWERLGHLPAFQRAYTSCVDWFSTRADVPVFVSGSLANGSVDEFSDIDFELLWREDPKEEDFAWVREGLEKAGDLLSIFPATHIGMPNLLVSLVKVDSALVKIDINLLTGELIQCDGRIQIAGPETAPASSGDSDPPEPDFEDIYRKFAVWLWNGYAKIARGELLEGVDSIEFMRSQALLPALHFLYGLPCEGFRRLETRLPPDALQSLRATYPNSIERPELLRCLFALAYSFSGLQERIVAKVGRDYRSAAELEEIASVISEREGTGIL